MRSMKVGALLLGALLLSSCSCKHIMFPNDHDSRPICKGVKNYTMVLPDNTTRVILSCDITWRDFQCIFDNTYCFDGVHGSDIRKNDRTLEYLWRI